MKKYDLEDRTGAFAESVIDLCRGFNHNTISRPLISQLIRSSASVGANYLEANGAGSKKDFRNKIIIAKKELQETKHWLRLVAYYFPEQKTSIDTIRQECQELIQIFQKIISTLDAAKTTARLELEN